MFNKNKKIINSYFLKNVIQSKYDEIDVKILVYSVEPASRPLTDQTYHSSVSRIFVRYTSQDTKDCVISIVVKNCQATENENDQRTSRFLIQEQFIYNSILPRFHSLFYDFGDVIRLTPIFIHYSNYPIDVLFLEDLSQSDFSTLNPQDGLDFNQTKITLEKLAFFHAASAIDISKNANEYNIFDERSYVQENDIVKKFTIDCFNIILNYLCACNGNEDIFKKLNALVPNLWLKFIKDTKTIKNELTVLNHGDLSCTNIMFKYSQNELCDVIFIDFQHSFVGSPVFDLMHFFATSVDYPVLELCRDYFIFIYHDTLVSVLRKLDYQGNIPTLLEFREFFYKRKILELILTVIIGPFLRQNNIKFYSIVNGADRENILSKFEKSLNLYSSEIIRQLNIFDKFGVLDCDPPEPESKVRKLMRIFENV